jgi:hypothetical protein
MMKKNLTIAILILVSISIQLLTILPWWSFLIAVFLLGMILPLKKWNVSAFLIGFASGFLAWSLSTFYFEIVYKSEIINTVAKMISVPYILLYIIIGIMGGLPSGLAFYSGFLLRKGKEKLHLEL